MNGKESALTVEDLHKSFGDNKVLTGISISAYKGDVISVLGSSGSGKSTLLRCVNFLEIPDRGRITVCGEEVLMKKDRQGNPVPKDRKQVERVRTKLAMVFQQFNLWSHMTVLENVIEAPIHVLKVPRSDAIEKAKSYLEKVGISDKLKAYPAHLSGGQQQRVAVARAIVSQPTLILADEPTANLDTVTSSQLMDLFVELNQNHHVTFVIATHDVRVMKYAKRLIKMEDGKIISDETQLQVLTGD